ncbi:hypothetical protein [Brevibacillus sp. NRS-1366]|uniref:hypothetical protein n=1 Tax=Brevibacillus sp. NRS-1366 TaxID=3233899 RepID=UPI003D1AD3EC
MQEDVRIQLNEEPRLHSPLRTVVGIDPQSYTFFFREAMDQVSVEVAIRNHAKVATSKEDLGFIEPGFTFHWASDRQLQLLVTVPQKSSEEIVWQEVVLPPQQIWQISVDGKTCEKWTDFSVMTNMEFLDSKQRYVLLSRFTNYCECDALYEKLYSVYDMAGGHQRIGSYKRMEWGGCPRQL